jgi:hypothetical protein
VSWSRDSSGFCCSKSCLTFSAVVRSGIVQMDHNASKRFPPTVLTDAFHQIPNNWFDKEDDIVFHAFRHMQQTFDPCATSNNRNEELFGLHFLLRNFRHVIWTCGPARMTKIFKKNQLSFPVNMFSNSVVDLVRVFGEALGEVRPAKAFGRLSVRAELNFSKCKSSWSTYKQVALPIFSLRQSALHAMNGNRCNNN